MADYSTLVLPDGRVLAWQEYGAAGGRPLYVFHGFPGSRLQVGLVHAQAAAAGVRLIAPDRPGFGASDPAPARRMLDWADDLAQLADRLGHERFGVLGVSCGGPYALACAVRLAPRLDYVGTMAGVGSMDVPALRRGQMAPLRLLFGLARLHPRLAAPLLALDALLLRRNPERAVRKLAQLLTGPDRRLLAERPELAAAFGRSMAEAYAQGTGGARCEAALIAAPREFDLREIGVPVFVYQGGDDRHVPLAMARHMAGQIPGARLRVFPDEGHLSVLVNRFGSCLQDLAACAADPAFPLAREVSRHGA